jgi:hypothetical protein
VGDGLVEQRERIAHAAGSALGDVAQGGRLEGHLLRLEDARQVLDDVALRHLLEVELQAAREHRHRDFLRVGGGKDELDVLGRLLQRLQHGVEGRGGQHVHFVDDVHLEAAARRRVGGVLQQLAHLVDLGVGRGVDLDEVHEAAGIDLLAGCTTRRAPK